MGKQIVETKTENKMPVTLAKMETCRGSEDVGLEDMVIPRLEICQAMSDCKKKSNSAFIKGIEEGQMYNNVTREIYGISITVVPVKFKKEYLLWRDRDDGGGGFHGAFPTLINAEFEKDTLDRPDMVEATETPQQLCVLVKANGALEEAVIPMSKTKRKISKNWNSLIRLNGGDRFSRKYTLEVVLETNKKGDEYYNFKISNLAEISADESELLEVAEMLYTSIECGAATLDRSVNEAEEVTTAKEF